MNEESTTSGEIIYTVVAKTAARSNDGMFDLDPLTTVIDPELVESFARTETVTAESELRFHYHGCEVCVEGTGEITVQQR